MGLMIIIRDKEQKLLEGLAGSDLSQFVAVYRRLYYTCELTVRIKQ